MALSRAKYRRVPDLYVTGKVVTLKDGTPAWVQVLNPWEKEEATRDAQAARGLIVLALQEHGSDDMVRVRAGFFSAGRDKAIEVLLDEQYSMLMYKAMEEIANDPEWKERLEIAARQEEILAREETDPERALLTKINEDYLVEVRRITDAELALLRTELEALEDEQLVTRYAELYIDRIGSQRAMAEHQLTEIWYGVRACEGVQGEDGQWDHKDCEGHEVRVYDSKAEARVLPEELQKLYTDAFQELNLTVREAKNSDRQGSSFASSPLPSEPAASTPSTPDETPAAALGT